MLSKDGNFNNGNGRVNRKRNYNFCICFWLSFSIWIPVLHTTKQIQYCGGLTLVGCHVPTEVALPTNPLQLGPLSPQIHKSCQEHFVTLLSTCSYTAIFPLLNSVISEVLPPSLMGSALASGGSIVELAGIDSIGHERSF